MSDLVQFLLDRLAIEAHVAKAASPGPWHVNPDDDEVLAVDDIVVAEGFALSGRQLRATIEHIARHDPARVLAEVEAKRRIVDAHGHEHECISLTDSGNTSAVDGKPWALWELEHTGDAERPCFVLRCIALPYADHPDYRDDWRP